MASIFNTSTTISGKVSRILNFVESGKDFYVGIGKPTPWDTSFGTNVSEVNPPSPTNKTLMLPEPIMYKKVKCVAPASRVATCTSFSEERNKRVCQDTSFNTPLNSEVLIKESFAERNYILYDPDEITIKGNTFNIFPEFVYIQAEISGEEYLADGWRCSGLFTKLFLSENTTPNQEIYLPNQVEGGLIQQITYNTFIERDDSKQHRFEYLINL